MLNNPHHKYQQLIAELGEPQHPLLLAYSGGVDSRVLLELLLELREQSVITEFSVIHIDHGLQKESAKWQESAARLCALKGITFDCVDLKMGNTQRNIEAQARAQRYQAIADKMQNGQWLLTAHHQNDQAETLLLRLLRGTGIRGASAMQSVSSFGKGWLVRPLLNCSKSAIEKFARQRQLDFVVDPSNDNNQFRRNFLRNEIIPRFNEYWPGCEGALANFSQRAQQATSLLDELAITDASYCQFEPSEKKLNKSSLLSLNQNHQFNLLNYLGHLLNYYPSQADMEFCRLQLLDTDSSALEMRFGCGLLRQYDGNIYFCDKSSIPASINKATNWDSFSQSFAIDHDRALVAKSVERGVRLPHDDEVVTVRFRSGGERCKPVGRNKSNKLKLLLQEYKVAPWRRAALPLIYYNDELVAVVGIFQSADFQNKTGQPAVQFEIEKS